MSWGPSLTTETYTVDGITTVWNCTIPFVNSAWLKCYQTDGSTFVTDVTALATIVVAVDPATGGTVTISPALAVSGGSKLILSLEPPLSQTGISLATNDELPAESAIAAWDYAIMLIAYLNERLNRCVSQNQYVGPTAPVLPSPSAGAVLTWGVGNTLVNSSGSGSAPFIKSSVTLTANATSTVVTNAACTLSSVALFTPRSGGFAGDIASGFFSVAYAAGHFTISHPSNPSTTRIADYVLTI